MSHYFDDFVGRLNENSIATDPPYLHGLLTGFATTPKPEMEKLWSEIGGHAGHSISEPLLGEAGITIEFIAKDLTLSEFQARFQADQNDEQEHWLKGYFQAVELHIHQWQELEDNTGMALVLLNSYINEEIRQKLKADKLNIENTQKDPKLITTLVQDIYLDLNNPPAAKVATPDDEQSSPPNQDPKGLAQLSEEGLFNLAMQAEDSLPLQVIDECASRGDAIIPLLKLHLENEVNWTDKVSSEAWWALLHAIFILGKIPGEASAQALLDGLQRMYADYRDDTSDWMDGYWPALCRNKRTYTTPTMHAMTENRNLYWLPRTHAASCVLADASANGTAELERSLDWIAGLCADETDDWDFRIIAALHLHDLPRERHRPLLEQLMEQQDTESPMGIVFDQKDIERAFSQGDNPEWERFNNPWKFYDPDEMEQRQRRWLQEAREEETARHGRDDDEPSETYTMEQPKIGRNDPCPCGSGKKYKKCCLNKPH